MSVFAGEWPGWLMLTLILGLFAVGLVIGVVVVSWLERRGRL